MCVLHSTYWCLENKISKYRKKSFIEHQVLCLWNGLFGVVSCIEKFRNYSSLNLRTYAHPISLSFRNVRTSQYWCLENRIRKCIKILLLNINKNISSYHASTEATFDRVWQLTSWPVMWYSTTFPSLVILTDAVSSKWPCFLDGLTSSLQYRIMLKKWLVHYPAFRRRNKYRKFWLKAVILN